MSERFQRSRKRGSKLPEGVVCCTRPGKWGNPFPTAAEFQSAVSVAIVTRRRPPKATAEQWARVLWIVDNIAQLAGKNLACWCSLNAECHVDTLLTLARTVANEAS